MLRFALPHVIAFFAVALFALPAQANEAPAAQRWGQTEATQLNILSSDPRTPRMPVTDFASEIYFDPTKLGQSSIILSMGFEPMNINPADKLDSEEEKDAKRLTGSFVSHKIKKVANNQFEAEGDLMFGNRKVPAKVPFTVNFDNSSAVPSLVFDGAFNLAASQFATGQQAGHYPGQLPLSFTIKTIPIKQ